MSLFSCRTVLLDRIWQPTVKAVRWRRVNVQRPRPPHYEKARLIEFCKPFYPPNVEKLLPLNEKCKKKEELEFKNFSIDNPYERILARRLTGLFNESQFIGIVHFNTCDLEERFYMNINFKREGMVFRNEGKKIVKMAVEGTKFEPILELFTSHQALVFSPELKVTEFFKIMKKSPMLILLAGIIEGQFVSVNQIQEYNRLKDITTARVQLLSVLNSASQQIVQNLNQHQRTLVSQLDQYVDIQNKESTSKVLSEENS